MSNPVVLLALFLAALGATEVGAFSPCGTVGFVSVGCGGGIYKAQIPGRSTTTCATSSRTKTRTTTTVGMIWKWGGGDDDDDDDFDEDDIDEGDLFRASKAARRASADDRLVELKRPLGIVLEEDAEGNVYVETVAPRGNAARSGLVNEGDVVTMCSATFGSNMWSCRGAGLSRVLSAIRIRAGPTVSLVLESPSEMARKVRSSGKAARDARDARAEEQRRKDELLDELRQDDEKLKKRFFGLF